MDPVTCAGYSDINMKLEIMKISHFKHDTNRTNLQVAHYMNEISIEWETYSEILRQQFNFYSTSSGPLSRDYMKTRRSEWEEEKEFTV